MLLTKTTLSTKFQSTASCDSQAKEQKSWCIKLVIYIFHKLWIYFHYRHLSEISSCLWTRSKNFRFILLWWVSILKCSLIMSHQIFVLHDDHENIWQILSNYCKDILMPWLDRSDSNLLCCHTENEHAFIRIFLCSCPMWFYACSSPEDS